MAARTQTVVSTAQSAVRRCPWVSGLKDHDGSRGRTGSPRLTANRRVQCATWSIRGPIVITYVEWMMLRPEGILTLRVRSRGTGVVMAWAA